MKKAFIFLLIFLLTVCPMALAETGKADDVFLLDYEEPEISLYPCQGATTIRNVNVRAEMSQSSRRVQQIAAPGTVITVTGEAYDAAGILWYSVRLEGGATGYVRGDLLNLLVYDDAPAASPVGTQLTPLSVRLVSGRMLDVYSGPGTYYLRGASGKAKIDTTGSAIVYGAEDGWLLVQYDISSTHWRFGYIPESAVAAGSYAPPLNFSYFPVTVQYNTTLTDDPMFSQSVLKGLHAGVQATYLASLGSWAYIECDGARGFVPSSAVGMSAFDAPVSAPVIAPAGAAMLVKRLSTRTGPARAYDEPGTFYGSDYASHYVTVLSRAYNDEIWWVQVEFQDGAALYRAYTTYDRVDIDISTVPEERAIATGVTYGAPAFAYYGPGPAYKAMKLSVPANTAVTVWASENGYLLVDYFDLSLQRQHRAWISQDNVYLYR